MKFAFVRRLPVPLSETITKIKAANFDWWILKDCHDTFIKKGDRVSPPIMETTDYLEQQMRAVVDQTVIFGIVADLRIVSGKDYRGMHLLFSSKSYHWVMYDTMEKLMEGHFLDVL